MKIYLSILGAVLTIVGLVNFIAPSVYLGTLGVAISDPSAMNVLHTYGGCYLGLAAFLFVSAGRPEFTRTAVVASTIVMAGFVAGRIMGLAVEGMPDRGIIVSTIIEIVFLLWGAALVRRHQS
jgi:hypothetical protein